MPWISLLAIFVLLVFGFVGFFKGFWRSFLSLFSSVVVIGLAFLIAKPVSSALESWFGLASAISHAIEGGTLSFLNSHNIETGWISVLLVAFLGKEFLASHPSNEMIAQSLSQKSAQLLLFVVCMIALYFLIKLVLFFVMKALKKLTFKTPMRALDRSLGIVFGLLKGLFWIVLVCFALFSLGGVFTGLASWIAGILEQNGFAKLLYDFSIWFVQGVIFPFIFH